MKHISKSKTIKTFLFGFLLLASAAINAQTNYYVRDKAHGGNDGYNGLSPDQAWQTVDAVNNHMSSFHPGDIINFERGSYFFGTLKIKASGGENRHITFRSYGTGDKPVFIDAVTIVPNNPDLNSSWNPLQNNVWTYTDNVMKAHKVDIANLVLVRGTDTSFGEKVMSADPSMLTRQGQFLYDYDKNQLELYSESKPSEFYSSIQTVLNENAIEFNKNSYLTFDNLAFKYYGRCVVEISGNNCNFSNLDIS